MKLRKKIKRDAVYGLARLMFWLLNAVPRTMAMFTGAMVGLAAWQLLVRERHRALRHLGAVFTDRFTPAQRYSIGRTFFVYSGKNLADAIRFRKHYASELKNLVEIDGMEHFDSVYGRGKGLVGVTGHIGNFELLAVHIANLGYDIAVIGREIYDPRLDELLTGNRTALGLTNIATTDSPRVVFRWLREGKAVGVLIDNDSTRVRGIHVPAFGRLSNTPVGQTIMALRTGAGLVPMACLRTHQNRYKIVIKPEVTFNPDLPDDEQIYEATSKCTNALEEIIRTYPEQWVWLHNRWRTKPKNTP
ncbi:MAG: lysophospholipid acyltransferase family protein [Candidatus Zixiibacteriota bacterium]|nr:MAG: lysophospholipid acyltransferase family protein [candidate division Zixibacteria bacterium]